MNSLLFYAIGNYYWTSPSIYLFIYLFLFFIFSRTTTTGFKRFQKLILHCITEIHKSLKSLVVVTDKNETDKSIV